MLKDYTVYDVCICESSGVENMVFVGDTIEEASNYIGVSTSALYKSLHTNGRMEAKGYYIELIPREV